MSDTGKEIFLDWSAGGGKDVAEVSEAKWDSLHPPYAVGWQFIAALATERSGGAFSAAAHEFEPVVGSSDTVEDDGPVSRMFTRYVWVERIGAAVDTTDMAVLDRQAFNARNYQVGDPADTKKCAWAVFMRFGARRKTVRSLTYRPAGGLFVREGEGECVNIWRPGPAIPEAPHTDADVEPWLQHLAYMVPVAQERETLLDWFAWVVQNPAEKPNWGVLIGGAHGIGKSTLLEPVRAVLGPRNVREIGPTDLASGYTGWLSETKLFVVEEMHSFERKETMQRLKSFLAAPPYVLQINPKFGKQYEIPNILAGLFFTNHENALALEKGDRRFFVIWSEAEPREAGYYARLMDWYRAGGAASAARWLLARDVTKFDAKGKAPSTDAKEEMRRSSRPLLDEILEDAIQFKEGPFAATIVALDTVKRWLPENVVGRGAVLTGARVAAALRRAGCRPLGQVWLPREVTGGEPVRGSLFSTRSHEIAAGISHGDLANAYVNEQGRLAARNEEELRRVGF